VLSSAAFVRRASLKIDPEVESGGAASPDYSSIFPPASGFLPKI
jgi:hypothetical protein